MVSPEPPSLISALRAARGYMDDALRAPGGSLRSGVDKPAGRRCRPWTALPVAPLPTGAAHRLTHPCPPFDHIPTGPTAKSDDLRSMEERSRGLRPLPLGTPLDH